MPLGYVTVIWASAHKRKHKMQAGAIFFRPVIAGDEQWVRLECRCGHHAVVCLPLGPWRHRDWILRRARCKARGQLGAVSLTSVSAPDEQYGGWGH